MTTATMSKNSIGLDDKTVLYLTTGDCWFLAADLFARYGHTFALVSNLRHETDEQTTFHALVSFQKNGDTYYADALGIHTADQVVEHWTKHFADIYEETSNYVFAVPSEEEFAHLLPGVSLAALDEYKSAEDDEDFDEDMWDDSAWGFDEEDPLDIPAVYYPLIDLEKLHEATDLVHAAIQDFLAR